MKIKIHLAILPLALIAGMALASEQPTAAGQQDKTDHSKMVADEFTALDKNQDGKLTKAELPKDSPVGPHFDMLDTDKDGSLSSTEFAGYHDM